MIRGKMTNEQQTFYDAGRTDALQTLAIAVIKLAPDLATELCARFEDANSSLDAFLAVLRAGDSTPAAIP